MFLCLKIYWNRQVFDLIYALGVWKKTETLRHQILNSIFQMGVGHKLLLQLFLISFCIFRSKLGKRSVQRFHLISGYYLDDQHNFHTFPGNPQQILAYSWYIFKSFIEFFFRIQNTSRLSEDIDDCKFDHYLNFPNC